MRAAIYTRVSTEDQEREGSSLDSQRDACLAKAKDLGYDTSEELVLNEVKSGLTLDRPYLDKLRNWVKSKEIQAVIVYSTDRLSRDPLHLLLLAEECHTAEVELCFITEPLDNSMEGQLLGFVRGWASKLEALKIKERSNRGMRQRALAGKLFTGKGTKLYGYDYVAGRGEGEGIRYVNEREAELVREMFRWYTEENFTIGAIARQLTSLGIPSPWGKRTWSIATVWNILKNEGYIGKTYVHLSAYNETLELRGATPPIINKAMFDQAQERLKRNKELASRNTKREYLLRGYAFCKQCGRLYYGDTHTKRSGKVYRYYRCGSSAKALHCNNKGWHTEQLDEIIWEQVEAVLSNPEVVLTGLKAVASEDRHTNLEEELRRAKERLIELDREQGELLQWALKGFPEDTIVKENKRINEIRAELLKRQSELEEKVNQLNQAQYDIKGLKQACQIVRDNLSNLSLETKRLALEALKVKVWLDKDNITLEGCLPIVSISARRI